VDRIIGALQHSIGCVLLGSSVDHQFITVSALVDLQTASDVSI